ncbi:Nucleoporin NUP35 [Frankliniella fusca]|uniref:Nucleoporin NUP53 n=1 Tax=Frankliniella fusca TaxID=407009 RepID=A0AAE1GZB3_9NEOP|nr:Nucleoporin NUP35 [Frankliniella fusca]
MEPMALGSPVGSPANMSSTQQFLPQFLLGESDFNQSLNQSLTQSHPGPSTARQLVMSPTSPGRHVTFSPPTLGGFGPALSSADSRLNRAPAPSGILGQSEKGSGPPTTGLFDTLNPSTEQLQYLSPTKPNDNSMYQSNLNASLLATSPPPTTPGSQTHHLSNEPLTSNWVTVFGFPTSATSSILAQFARYGNIVDKQLPVQGNWMHLLYQTKVEVRRALGNNGKVFGGNTMVGVMPCIDMAIVENTKENFRDPNISRASMSTTAGNMSFGTPTMGPPGSGIASPFGTPRSARPLQRAFSSTLVGDVVSPQHTPQRTTSFVSRAMDYVFNW